MGPRRPAERRVGRADPANPPDRPPRLARVLFAVVRAVHLPAVLRAAPASERRRSRALRHRRLRHAHGVRRRAARPDPRHRPLRRDAPAHGGGRVSRRGFRPAARHRDPAAGVPGRLCDLPGRAALRGRHAGLQRGDGVGVSPRRLSPGGLDRRAGHPGRPRPVADRDRPRAGRCPRLGGQRGLARAYPRPDLDRRHRGEPQRHRCRQRNPRQPPGQRIPRSAVCRQHLGRPARGRRCALGPGHRRLPRTDQPRDPGGARRRGARGRRPLRGGERRRAWSSRRPASPRPARRARVPRPRSSIGPTGARCGLSVRTASGSSTRHPGCR